LTLHETSLTIISLFQSIINRHNTRITSYNNTTGTSPAPRGREHRRHAQSWRRS
jgi:hypothetical protein